ncbi:hypothetical protein [Fulvivirga sediminis]|uniref:Lipoprotein n=1 Tax=Fulvivirga sediminis TaxID=2803949 RepID=A0A937FAL2_9BACT|nr:hypothetical protein [Fulvivirga sediminis]MBL3658366.1 hypothetical protein [Fulvivirga sediminis]
MKRLIYISVIIFMLLIACNSTKYTTVKHVKPVNRNRFFDRKGDKKKKRVKYVKVKILKKSPTVKPKKPKPPKKKKQKNTEELAPSDSTKLESIPNEPDSTGIH